MTKSPTDRYGNCSICDQPFTEDEWLDRHTSADGGDCHEECCDVCAEDDACDCDIEEQHYAFSYRGEAITELVAEAAARVTEANGFDGDEQAAQGCRLRPLAIGCGNSTSWRMWRNASSDPAYVRWVEDDMPMPDCTPFDDESVAGHGWPAEWRNGYVGTLDI